MISQFSILYGIIFTLCLNCLLLSAPYSFAEEMDNFKQSYLLEANGDYIQAKAKIKGFLGIGGDLGEFANMRYAWLNYSQKKYNRAILYYKKALALNSESIDAKLGISLVMLSQLRLKEAALWANQVLEQSPSNYTAHLYLMDSESGQKKWRQLGAHAKKVIKMYPTQVVLWQYLARAHAWLGKKELAKQAYTSVLLRLPEDLEAINFLALGKK